MLLKQHGPDQVMKNSSSETSNGLRKYTKGLETLFVSHSVISWIVSCPRKFKSLAILFSIVGCGLLFSSRVLAHPATGIVVDRGGNVYFSDLETVWKLDAKGGLFVFRAGERGRHVHELSIDERDNVYGADVSYKPSTAEWISDVWKMTRDGRITYLLEPTTKPPLGMSIWLDRAGNMYWVDQNNHTKKQTLLLKRSPEGIVTTLAGSSYGQADGKGTQARFSSIGGMFVAADDSIYLTDGSSVRRVLSDGTVTTIARNLDFRTREDDPRLFASYGGLAGLTVAPDGTVYVADAGKRRLLRIDRQGVVSVVMRSEPPFFPNGVAVSAGNVYVLEIGLTLPNAWSGPRIRKIAIDGSSTILGVVGSDVTDNGTTALGTRAGVAAERALVAITDAGRFKYLLAFSSLVLASTLTLVWLRRRNARS